VRRGYSSHSSVTDDLREGKILEKREGLWTRCPRLGGETPFTYCLIEAGELPCPRIVGCWQAFFPVETYLKRTLTPQRWEAFTQKIPQDKVSSLLTIVEETKKRQEQKG
jgi:hypothetical protein